LAVVEVADVAAWKAIHGTESSEGDTNLKGKQRPSSLMIACAAFVTESQRCLIADTTVSG